ncbi:hypothetical protein ACT54K_18975, partial [Leptospira interrogans]|uniref:hypothetical protein n=1 Tax=Leptospira interrogans TaxID=173 RepID=UPI004036784E
CNIPVTSLRRILHNGIVEVRSDLHHPSHRNSVRLAAESLLRCCIANKCILSFLCYAARSAAFSFS